MASQVLPKAQTHEMVVKELEKTYDLTTLLQQEVASNLNNSVNFEVKVMFEELQRALKSSLNFLCNGEGVRNNGIQGSTKRKRVNDTQAEPVNSRINVGKEVHTARPYDDGYLWRKYGRKNILNDMFPRDYYRCTYSSDYNCKAKKYVQRYCNGDPPQYKVIYIHNHTCNNGITNSKKMLDLSAKEIPQPSLSVSSHGCGIRSEEEHAVLLSCLKNVIGGSSKNPEMESAPKGCDDVLSQPMEASDVDLAFISQAWEMDDMFMMDRL